VKHHIPRAKYLVLCAGSGLIWGSLGAVLAHGSSGYGAIGGLIASPAIGVLVGALLRGPFQRGRLTRPAWALLSVYVATGLFGAALGAGHIVVNGAPSVAWAPLVETALSTWWAITVSGVFVAFWALAYANFVALARLTRTLERPAST